MKRILKKIKGLIMDAVTETKRERYKAVVGINGRACIYKRYGTSEDEVKKELVKELKEYYTNFTATDIISVEKDKTHPVVKEN